jgi:uncharacterized zinc-type alcohol dehydrogenase-like protein
MKINAYAIKVPHMPLQKFVYEKDPRQNEIVISIKYCSVTRGDVRFIDNFWGDTNYPLVPGLEIIGTIEKTGRQVQGLTVGDIVGIGYQVSSCSLCEYCLTGKEQFCQQQKLIPINDYGGFADKIIVDYRFVYKMPEKLQSAVAAPLLCSGLTTYTAITKNGVKKGMNVGVIGIGSLGHLALQFLDKLECNVTAFSHTKDKQNILKKLGAKQVIISDDEKALQNCERTYDFILSTSSADLPWSKYIKILKPEGILCFVGLPPEPISFKAELLADYAQRSVVGNYIGSKKDMQAMLRFAEKHNIRALVDIFPMEQVNDVITKIRKNETHFSVVLTR